MDNTITKNINDAKGHVLCNPMFRRWWIGATISLLGDQFYLVALPWLVLQQTRSGIALGTLLMTAALPRTVLFLVGGAISDRISPRKIMLVTASARALLLVIMSGLLWLHALRLWELYLLSFVFGVADAFALPAFQTYLPSLVNPEQFAQANSAAQGAYQLSTIAGPLPAAFTVRAFGAAWALFFDGLSFLAIIASLWTLPDSAPVSNSPRTSRLFAATGEGLRYVWRDAALRTLICMMGVLNFCMFGPLIVGLAYLGTTRFHSPTAYGIWISTLSAGSLIGVLLAGFPRKYKRGPLLVSIGGAFGLASILLVYVPGLWLPAADLFAMGIMSGLVNVQITAWIQQRSDRSMLGRVSGVQMFFIFGSMPLSLALAGFLVQWSVIILFVSHGILMIVVAAVGGLNRTVRMID